MAVLLSLEEDIQETLGDLATISAALRARAKAGDLDAATLRLIDTELQGIDEEVAGHRDTLDGQDPADALVTDRAEAQLAAWRWDRAVRRRLILIRPTIRATRQAAQDLLRGTTRKVRVVREGETLQSIAQSELGDWRNWTALLDANPDVDPGAPLPSGTHLTIPQQR